MTVRILTGDCRNVLRTLPEESVHCVVTSPPYWGLRDYKIPPSIWGGDAACEHDFSCETIDTEIGRGNWTQDVNGRGERQPSRADGKREAIRSIAERGFCRRCNAWRGNFGLEPTYGLYVAHAVEIFREVWRVLRADGTLWLNLGDCYCTMPRGNKPGDISSSSLTNPDRQDRISRGTKQETNCANNYDGPNRTQIGGNFKNKDLVGIPWRVAFALQDDGWYLRRDIIWEKLNPMPESVWDRPTTSHEYLFLLAKSGRTLCWRHRAHGWTRSKPAPDYVWRHRRTGEESIECRSGEEWMRVNLWRGFDYYYDAPAIMELSSPNSHARAGRGRSDHHKYADGGPGNQTIARGAPSAGRLFPVPTGWDKGDGSHGTIHRDGRRAKPYGPNSRANHDRVPGSRKLAEHAAAGPRPKANDSYDEALRSPDLVPMRNKRSVWRIASEPFKEAHFATFPPALVEPCILAGCPPGGVVLDPFGGAGTTGLAADRQQRDAILIDINPNYVAMARKRVDSDAPLFAGAAE